MRSVHAASSLFWAVFPLTVAALAQSPAKHPLTIADTIEAARAVPLNMQGDRILLSPDGKRYLVVLIRGDIVRDGCWLEFISGGTESLDAATRFDTVARLFTNGKPTGKAQRIIRGVRWLDDNESVGFLWDDGVIPPHLVTVNIRTHQVKTLTHSTEIANYDIGKERQTVIYVAPDAHDTSKLDTLRREGFAVVNQDVWSLLSGNLDGWSRWNPTYQTFVVSQKQPQPQKLGSNKRQRISPPATLLLSPDGRYALMDEPATEFPKEWDEYTQNWFKNVGLPQVRRDPDSISPISQFHVVDLEHATSRALWNAPANFIELAVWSPDSRSVVIGPTFMPVEQADAAGLAGRAVVEVDISTGRFSQIPIPADSSPRGYAPLNWNDRDVIEVSGRYDPNKKNLRFKKVDGQWHTWPDNESTKKSEPPVRIELRQDPNTPPVLFAVETATGRERMVLDLNPQLRDGVALGKVELVHWKDSGGRAWSGLLYYPVHYATGHQFPLVIQTHGYLPKEFSLEGLYTTAYAAQALANHDIAVLQMGSPDSVTEADMAKPSEVDTAVAGYESAIKHFATVGLIIREKVGILGFSRTGWYVEYALTHSSFAFAAAIVADNMDASYVSYITGTEQIRSEWESDNGAAPYGDGLREWLRRAPRFNTDKVHTPLRMELDSGGPARTSPAVLVLNFWEMFSHLRHLRKPEELFIIPDIERGVHLLQNPAQRLASLGGTVDWFDFWLKEEEDPDPAKAEQYTRWRQLRKLQQQNEKNSAAPSPK